MERCLNCGAYVLFPYSYVSEKTAQESEENIGEFVICSQQCAMQFSHLEYVEKRLLVDTARKGRILE